MYFSSSKDYKPNGHHTYAVYKDKKTNKYRAIQLTHLYEPKKVAQIEKGQLKVEKLSCFKYPTGVRNNYYDKYLDGNDLNFGKGTKHQFVGYVPNSQAKRIRDFAKKKHK